MSDFRNGANDLKVLVNNLWLEKERIEEKIKHMNVLFRLIELSENYTTSVLQTNFKRDELINFCQAIMTDETGNILRSYPKFAKAVHNALNHHGINTQWTNYFNVFDVGILSKREVESILTKISNEQNIVVNKSDYEMVDKLLDYVIGFTIDDRVNNLVETISLSTVEVENIS